MYGRGAAISSAFVIVCSPSEVASLVAKLAQLPLHSWDRMGGHLREQVLDRVVEGLLQITRVEIQQLFRGTAAPALSELQPVGPLGCRFALVAMLDVARCSSRCLSALRFPGWRDSHAEHERSNAGTGLQLCQTTLNARFHCTPLAVIDG